MAIDKLTPTDSRVTHHTVTLPESRGKRSYHYLLASPSKEPSATILLVHGFPDLSFGWRYQIPYLLSLNLRVIVPDQLGYGGTDAPDSPTHYSYKNIVDDLVALVKLVVPDEPQILLGGHDWGGAIVWRLCLWHPQLIRAVFSVCTPYAPPARDFVSKKDLVANVVPNFGYQLQFEGTQLEEKIQSLGRDGIRRFLSALYGARDAEGKAVMRAKDGVVLEKLEQEIGKPPTLSEEELEFYVSQYERNGIHGPLNWYRTYEINYEEERELLKDGRLSITQPAMMVTATADVALPPAMAAGMGKWTDSLMRREVEASHWALWEKPDEINGFIGEFLGGVLNGGGKAKASI